MQKQTQGTSPTRQQRAPSQKQKPKQQAIYRKPKSGDTIDERYRVVGRPLGKGGMGTVYRIEDEAGVQYALKRLDPALRGEKRFEKRFLLEYEAAAQLKHPNIAAYQELFEADGALHIRMELIDGINLRQLLKREKRLSVPIATGIARALARALEHLHEQQIVHRDIKPENVLLGRDGSIKLTDFGISRLEYAGVTRTGTIMGTPRYMSPEQLAGKKGEAIGTESDMYSLGVLLYELLVGKDPYRLKQKAEVLEVINVKHEKRARPLPTDFDAALGELLMSLLEHDPEERLRDAKRLGQALGSWSASRKDLRHAISDWADELGPNRPKKAKQPASTRKRDSFWQDPTLSEPPAESLPPPPLTQGRELLPAFMATIVFLVFLWGLGFWYQKGGDSGMAAASLQRTAPRKSSATPTDQAQYPAIPPELSGVGGHKPKSKRKHHKKRTKKRRKRRKSKRYSSRRRRRLSRRKARRGRRYRRSRRLRRKRRRRYRRRRRR